MEKSKNYEENIFEQKIRDLETSQETLLTQLKKTTRQLSGLKKGKELREVGLISSNSAESTNRLQIMPKNPILLMDAQAPFQTARDQDSIFKEVQDIEIDKDDNRDDGNLQNKAVLEHSVIELQIPQAAAAQTDSMKQDKLVDLNGKPIGENVDAENGEEGAEMP